MLSYLNTTTTKQFLNIKRRTIKLQWVGLDSNQRIPTGGGFMPYPRIELGIYMSEILDHFLLVLFLK